jgi:hypothetical protein
MVECHEQVTVDYSLGPSVKQMGYLSSKPLLTSLATTY